MESSTTMSGAAAAPPAPAAEPTAAEQFAAAGLSTAPFDARFPNQRQTKSCWQNFIDYHRCVKAKGEDYAPCDFFWRTGTHCVQVRGVTGGMIRLKRETSLV